MATRSVTWMPLKPTFSASKVAALINMNPFEKVFDAVYDTMAKHDIPMGTADMDGRLDSGQIHKIQKQQLEQHFMDLIQPHVDSSTTSAELDTLQKNLAVLGPLGQQAATYARLRYGQLQENNAIASLKTQGRYGKSQSKTMDFTHFYLTGKTDGTLNDVIVEIKNRTRRLLGVTDYERPQFECYMRLFNSKQLYLCERLDSEERNILLFANDELWDTIVQRLTWVAQFMTEVQEQPYLQQITKEDLEFHFHQFVAERAQLYV
jgi:hypothetical protein